MGGLYQTTAVQKTALLTFPKGLSWSTRQGRATGLSSLARWRCLMSRWMVAVLAAFSLSACIDDGGGETDVGAQVDGGGAGAAGGAGGVGAAGGAGGMAPSCPGGALPDACGVCGGPGLRTFFPDVDADGLGDGRLPVQACLAPDRYVDNGDDREPECATNNTDACGTCGGDGELTWYLDADGDGQGDDQMAVESCVAPRGYVAEGGDPEPACATNNTDPCGTCGGNGVRTLYADQDGDGLGDPATPMDGCLAGEGFVANSDDLEPECPTNDTDACGSCGGPGLIQAWADADGDGLGDPEQPLEVCFLVDGLVQNADDLQPDCATNDRDDCGACGGHNRAMDCAGQCNGEARPDGCGVCSGGGTGVEPQVADADGDGIPDACDDCPQAQNRILVVQWQAVPHFDRNSGGPYTFQVLLYQNGDFRFQYQQMEPFAASATVGYQLDPNTVNDISQNNDFVLDHPVVHVHPRDDGRYEADYVRPLEWFDISELGQPLNLADDGDRELELGFPFPFRGAVYNTVRVSANGMVVIDGGMPGYANGGLPSADSRAFLAPFWDDLNPGAGGQIYWYVATPACEDDCNAVPGGFAFTDACGLCVAGDTGRLPSENVDCNGDCDGEAFVDECGQCVGGNTGIVPSAAADCRPDLTVDEAYLRSTMILDYLEVNDQCLIDERCVHGVGRRKLLRFGTRIANVGPADLRLGRPMDGVDHWIWGECHQHFHYEAYAAYELFDPRANVILPIGAKSGFSVIDIGVWDPQLAPNGCHGYNGNDQGITSGCQDTYSRNLQCQWIDITDVPDGTYEVIVTTNPEGQIPEVTLDNNSARARVDIQGDRLQLLDP